MRRLQEIEAVATHETRDAGNVGSPVERLPQHRVEHRLASAMRARTNRRRDRDERRGLALAPADMAAGGDADEQRILAAVALERDLGHREIEEVDGIDLHR